MAWFEDWFDQSEYELVYPHRDREEAEKLVDLIELVLHPKSSSHILDVACGRGRHARTFARRGYRVTGIDLSPEAIHEASERSLGEGLDVSFEVGDMREPHCSGCADGVVNLFSSFGYFQREEDHQRAIDAMAEALVPGGWFVQDFMNAPHVVENLVEEDRSTRNDVEIHQRRWIESGRINKEITLHREGMEQTFRESVRLFTLADFEYFYERAELDLIDVYGTYSGDPHSDETPRLILFSRKSGGS